MRNNTRPTASKIMADAFGTTTRSSLRNARRRTIGAFSTMLVVDRTTPSLIPSHGSRPEIRKRMYSLSRDPGPREHVGEHEPVQDDQAERLEDRPEDPQRRAGEPGSE